MLFIAAAIVLSPAFTCALFADEDLDDPNLRVFEGNVTAVNVGSSMLTVDGPVPAKFMISGDTKIVSEVDMYADDIKLSDISVGDYVRVEYLKQDDGKVTSDKVLRISIEHGVKDMEAQEE
jgi:hypothetical protein